MSDSQLKLTAENYYSAEADNHYMSVSQFKRWRECPAAAKAQYVDGTYKPETSDAMLHGSYFHGLFDGTAEKFLQEHPELLTAKGKKTAPIEQLDAMFQRVKKDPYFMRSVEGQHEVIYTAEISGVLWKMKADVVNFDYMTVTDIKTVRDFAPVWDEVSRKKLPFWQVWGYDMQLAIYKEIIRKNTGYMLTPVISAVTKEKVTDYDIIAFMSTEIQAYFAEILRDIEVDLLGIGLVKSGHETRRCGVCDYCKQTKILAGVTEAKLK